MSRPHCMIIAISGASASGKSLLSTTIYEELVAELGSDQVAVISEDSYYLEQSHLSMEQRLKINYDHPDSMDHDLLKQHLETLLQGGSVDVPIYDYVENNRTGRFHRIENKRVIILEGIMLLVRPDIRRLFHTSIFVDTPLDICLIRRLHRDVVERGRSMDSVLNQYRATVRPMFMQFVQPSKQHADLIVPRGGKNRIAIDLLKVKIRQLLTSPR